LFFFIKRKSDMDYTQFTNIELLQQLFGSRAARRMYRGSLAPLFAPAGKLGRNQHCLAAARELVKRWLEEQIRGSDVFSKTDEVTEYLRVFFAGKEHESFVVLFLTTQHALIVVEELFRGTLSETAVYPREIMKRALQVNAGAVIIAHNHPSGVAEPSPVDIHMTTQLKRTLALVGVDVLDHFVIAGNTAVSFVEGGLL
jgi:DNA repair protein RadC